MFFDFDKPFTFDRVVRLLLTVLLFVGIFWLLRSLSSVLWPFFLAWLLAYMLFPVVRFFQYRLRLRVRILAIFATFLSVSAVVTLIALAMTPSIKTEAGKIAEIISDYIADSPDLTALIPDSWRTKLESLESLHFDDTTDILTAVRDLAPQAWRILAGTVNFVLGLFVVFVILLYMLFILLDYEELSDGWKRAIPERYKPFVLRLAADVEEGMNRYFRSQALIAFIVGILFSIGFLIIGLPLAIFLGLLIGLLNMVPYLQTVGVVPAVLLMWLKVHQDGGSFGWGLFALAMVFLVVQALQDLVLTPRIMGQAMKLNPAIILLSLSVFGYALGMVGMIIALPATALLISYYKKFILSESSLPSPTDTPDTP